MARFLKYTLYILFLPLWWIQVLIPRKKNIWIFGAWYGYRYSDNSKYLFEYVNNYHKEIKAVWLTRDVGVRDSIRDKGGVSFLTNNINAIYYSLLAKNILVSSGKRDINFLFINGATKIQLWHGSPLKKIGLDDSYSNVNSFSQKIIMAKLFPFSYEYNYDYTLSNSQIFTNKMSSAFNLSVEQVWETGCPRNDIFYSQEMDIFNQNIRKKHANCKIVYYLPTFRNFLGAKSLFTLADFDRSKIESFLEEQNIVFVSKGHYVDNILITEKQNVDSRIIDLKDHDVSEINFMLKDADLLITDYSSAYFDFLLTERPIIFAAFDLKEYLSGSRDMYFDYESTVAGPIVKNWDELMKSLKSIWKEKRYKDLIVEKNNIYNKYHDSDNSKRVYQAIIKLTQ